MLRKKFCLILIALLLLLNGCHLIPGAILRDFEVEWKVPGSGIWYCEDLQMQLCFEQFSRTSETDDDETYSYAILDGYCIMCLPSQIGTPEKIFVLLQEDAGQEKCGDIIFTGEYVSLSNDCYILRGEDKTEYTFKEIGSFVLADCLNRYSDEIERYKPNTSYEKLAEMNHVAVVAEGAIELWTTEFGAENIQQYDSFCEGEVEVSFDLDEECWYVHGARPKDVEGSVPMALIQKNGDVVAVWKG